jgi:hypothetical protein
MEVAMVFSVSVVCHMQRRIGQALFAQLLFCAILLGNAEAKDCPNGATVSDLKYCEFVIKYPSGAIRGFSARGRYSPPTRRRPAYSKHRTDYRCEPLSEPSGPRPYLGQERLKQPHWVSEPPGF